MKSAHVKPADGITMFRMPDDNYRPMPLEGIELFLTPYYIRALRDGDIVIFTPAEPEAAPSDIEPAHDAGMEH